MKADRKKMDVVPAKFATVFLAITFSGTAFSQQDQFAFEITPYGAYRFGGEFEETDSDIKIDLDDHGSFGVLFNARHSPNTQWEILYSRQETTAANTGLGVSDPVLDIGVQYLQAGGTYEWDGPHVRPYLAATLGVMRAEVDNPGYGSDSFFSFSVGLGLQVRPSERLGIRLEARSYGSLLDSNTSIFCKVDPMSNVCAIRIDGTVFWQLETFAGLVFRF